MALAGGEVVGTIRLNFHADGGLGKYPEMYDLGTVGAAASERTVGLALIVDPG